MKKSKNIIRNISFISFLLVSCATNNPYSDFYRQQIDISLIPTNDVKLVTISANQYTETRDQLIVQNYQIIGSSSFNGTLEDKNLAIKHGKSIGADIVLLSVEYTDTALSSGVAVGNGSPPIISKRRYNQIAVFFSKNIIKMKYGVHFDLLSTEEKKINGINYGLKVTNVVNHYPMFEHGIIPGDILLELDGRKLIYREDLFDDDNETLFKVLRNKKEFYVTVLTEGFK